MKNRFYSLLLIPALVMALIAIYSPANAGFKGFLAQHSGITVCVGPFIQMASANTPYTQPIGGPVNASGVSISKNGGAMTSKNDPGGLSLSGNSGYYLTSLNGTDTDTAGILVLTVFGPASTANPLESGFLLVEHTYQIVNPFIYAAFYSSGDSDYLHVDVIQHSGVTTPTTNGKPDVQNVHSGVSIASHAVMPSGVTLNSTAIVPSRVTLHTTAILPSGATLPAGAITAAAIATDAIDADAIATDAVTELTGGIWNATRSSYTSAHSFGVSLGSLQSGVSIDRSGVSNVNIATSGVTLHPTAILPSGATLPAGAITSTVIATDAIGADELATDGLTEISGSLWNSTRTSYTAAHSFGVSLGALQSGVSIDRSGVSNVNIATSGVTLHPTAIVPAGVTLSSTAIVPAGVTLHTTAIVPSGVTMLESGITTVVNHVWGKKFDEPLAGAPLAAQEIGQELNYLYRGWRNKTNTISSGVSTYGDDGVTPLWQFDHSDSGSTYQKEEVKAP